MSAISDATLGEETTTIEVENAENLSTRDLLEQAYEKLETPEPAVEVKAEPEIKVEAAVEDVKSEDTAVKAEEEVKADDAGSVKAPRMWSPQARDKFASLPEDVQQEVMKRERDIDTKLRETAQERQIATLARQTLDPYLDHFRESGVAPFQAVGELLRLGKLLRTGSSAEKALVIAQLTTTHKVDIRELEDQLVSHITRPAPAPEVTAIDQRLRQLEQQNSQQMVQAKDAQTSPVIEAFVADPKNEFVQDVWQEMVLLLNSGKSENLQDAYETACHMNKQVRQTMQTRSQQQANRISAGTASVKGGAPRSTQNAKPVPKTTRAALEAAWDEAVGE